MQRIVTVKFKDGNKITVEPKDRDFGLLDLGNGMSLSLIHGVLYKEKGNIICGKDITDTVDAIEVSMKHMEDLIMNFEFVVIYKQDFGAKYSCIDVVARNTEEAREYVLNFYSHMVTDENIVKVVKLGRVS